MLSLLFALAVPDALATDVGRSKRLGVGVEIGTPTGLSAKYFFNEKQGVSVHLGAWAAARLTASAQFEFEFLELGNWSWARADLYGLAGVEGGYVYVGRFSTGEIGAFGGAAAELQFDGAPVNLYLEAAVGLTLAGDGVQPIVLPVVHSVLGSRWHF